MPNRILSADELIKANELLSQIRANLETLAGNDPELLFAYRRKIAKELVYDERGKTMHRVKLKAQKRGEQGGLCSICSSPLPEKGAILDRLEAMKGYIAENTRLICPVCDGKVQASRNYQ